VETWVSGGLVMVEDEVEEVREGSLIEGEGEEVEDEVELEETEIGEDEVPTDC